jgi:hypothetical protein
MENTREGERESRGREREEGWRIQGRERERQEGGRKGRSEGGRKELKSLQ